MRCCRTHPELLDPPSPEEVASFVDPANNYAAPVMNPVDYVRSPGATMAMSSARRNIKKIQAELATTHEAAETAKATYEAEEAKSSKLKTEYQQYRQQMQAMMRQQRMRAGMAGHHNWSPDMDTAASRTDSRNLMWSANAKAPEHKNNDVDPDHWKIDTEKMEDPAAEFRKNFYNKQEEAAFLARQMQEHAMQGQQSGRMQQEGSPLMQQSGMMYQQPREPAMRTVEGQQLRMLEGPQDEMGMAREGLEERNSRIAKEAYMLRENRQLQQLQRDTARLALARSRLAQASRVQRVFTGAKFAEGCPEGTPGCGRAAHFARGRQEEGGGMALTHELDEERVMSRLGDNMVPVDEARQQRPGSFYGQ